MESSKFFVSRLGNISLQTCLSQAPFDPCLFIGKKVITICYVDDLIFWARNENNIVELAIQLHAERVDLEREDDVAGFLGVPTEHNPETGYLNMAQNNLIKQLLKTLGLKVGTANGKFAPVERKPLAKHMYGSLSLFQLQQCG